MSTNDDACIRAHVNNKSALHAYRTGAPHICAGRVSEGVQKEHEDVHVSTSGRYVHWC